MKSILIWGGAALGVVGIVLLLAGVLPEVGIALTVIGLVAAGFTTGGAAGIASSD